MDSSSFSTRLDVVITGIIDYVRQLMQGIRRGKFDRRYKLNAYGECDAKMVDKRENSRLHLKRTRRLHAVGTCLAPSLSFCPTIHEGGVFHLCHKGEEWTFDSAAITSSQEIPSVACV